MIFVGGRSRCSGRRTYVSECVGLHGCGVHQQQACDPIARVCDVHAACSGRVLVAGDRNVFGTGVWESVWRDEEQGGWEQAQGVGE